MGFACVDDQDMDLVSISCVKVVIGGTLLPEGRSGKGAED